MKSYKRTICLTQQHHLYAKVRSFLSVLISYNIYLGILLPQSYQTEKVFHESLGCKPVGIPNFFQQLIDFHLLVHLDLNNHILKGGASFCYFVFLGDHGIHFLFISQGIAHIYMYISIDVYEIIINTIIYSLL